MVLDKAGYPAYNEAMNQESTVKKKSTLVRRLVGSSGEKPVYVQVEEQIKRLIRQENLRVGDKIPGRDALCEKFKVSDLTVRKAIGHLVNQGVLVSKKSQGTFVASDPKVRKVLFVCGVDSLASEISPFFSHFLSSSQREANQHGLVIEPLWLSNDQPEASFTYCNDNFFRGYVGCIFIGCRLSHPLYCYYVENDLANYVHITHEHVDAKRVTTDLEGSVAKAIEYLHKAGNEEIMVFCDHDTFGNTKKVAKSFKKPIHILEVSLTSEMVKCEASGYSIAKGLLSEDKMPSGVIFIDDLVARGASRAALQAQSYLAKKPDWVVFCGLTEMVPLGLPVAYIALDTNKKAKEAVRILVNQINNRTDQPDRYIEKPDLILPHKQSEIKEQMFRSVDYSLQLA